MKKLFLILLISINLFAWEINTHRAIDREALENVENLNTFVTDVKLFESYEDEIFEDYDMTYFKYIEKGEKNGLSEETIKQDFSNSNYKFLIEAGTILEDAQWPHWDWIPNKIDQADGRFLNHFYNYQSVLYKSFHGIANHAVEWAYDTKRNKYDYTDAMSYFAKGFSETKPSERRKYQAKMFVSVGQIMHLVNDMSVPAHTRDDGHNPDMLEAWMKGGENHDREFGYYIKGSKLAPGHLTPMTLPVLKYDLKFLMINAASYSSKNFFSDDTIFTTVFPRRSETSSTQVTPMKWYIYNKNNIKIGIHVESYIRNALHEIIGTKEEDKLLLGNTSVFDGDFSVLKESGEVLISHAIANASNFVNYFFRGHIKTEVTSCGLQVTNESFIHSNNKKEIQQWQV